MTDAGTTDAGTTDAGTTEVARTNAGTTDVATTNVAKIDVATTVPTTDVAGIDAAETDAAGSAGVGAVPRGADPRVRERSHSWQDPRSTAAAARGVDGLTFLRHLAAGDIPPAPIAATLGMTVLEVEAGRVVFSLEPAEFHYNPIGSVHGGVFATLLDSACGCAVHSTLPAGVGYTSLDLSVKFLRGLAASSGPVRCEGVVVHRGRRTALAEARLTDGSGRLYAHATSSCLILRPREEETGLAVQQLSGADPAR